MKINFLTGIFLVILVSIIPLFAHLDHIPVEPYDEARLAINSLEMYQGKSNLLIPTYENAPDMWNTKPPLVIWLQVLFMKVFGINEIAIRLPSALAALCTCLLLFWFCKTKLKRPLLGILAVMILVTSQGYIRIHGTRTADYDAVLVFFTTAYCLFFYSYLLQKNKKYAYLSFLTLTLAILTKGIAGCLFIPALILFTISAKSHYFIFRSAHFYVGIGSFLVLSIGYYFLREQWNPGYIDAVLQNEISGRYNTVIENHEEDKWFYFYWIINKGFNYWAIMVPLGFLIGLQTQSVQLKKFIIFAVLLIITHFFIITQAQTKINWYDIPEYPFLSLLAAAFIFYLFHTISLALKNKQLKHNIIPFLLLISLFTMPYIDIIESINDPKSISASVENINMGYFLKEARIGKHNIKDYAIVWEQIEPNIQWYLMADEGKNNLSGTYSNNLLAGNTAAVSGENAKKYVEKTYFSSVLRNYHGVTVYKIHGRK